MRFSCRSVVAMLSSYVFRLAGFLSFSCTRHVLRCSDPCLSKRQARDKPAATTHRPALPQTARIFADRDLRPAQKKLRTAQVRDSETRSPVSSAKGSAQRVVSPPNRFDAFDQTQYRFRHHGMLRPALAKSGRAFVCACARSRLDAPQDQIPRCTHVSFFPHAFGNDNFSPSAMPLCGGRLRAGNRVIARRRARPDGRDKALPW